VNIDKKITLKQKISNFFGAIGYFCIVMQWFWVVLLYFSYIKSVISLMQPNNVDVKPAKNLVFSVQAPDPLLTLLGIIIAVVMLGLTIFILIKMPSTIAKTSQKIVQKTANGIAPTLLHVQNKKETKKNKIKLTFELIIMLKIILIILPAFLSFMSQFIEKQTFAFDITMFIGIFLAGFSVTSFLIQYSLANFLNVKKCDIF